jgi:hypothetical protein
VVRVNGSTPNAYWFDSPSKSLLDRRGPATEALIAQTLEPAKGYSYPDYYRVWPDTNSNTFMALVAHQVPGLDLELPVTAIGKNFLGDNILIGDAPSWTGKKFPIFRLVRLVRLTVAAAEGVKLTILGLSLDLDFSSLPLKLPSINRIGMKM